MSRPIPSRTPISSCSIPAIIREKAAEKVYSESRAPAHAETAPRRGGARGPGSSSPAGVAQARRAEGDPARGPRSSMSVVGPQAYHRLPAMVRAGAEGTRRAIRISRKTTNSRICRSSNASACAAAASPPSLPSRNGCDKFCAFCVVPYIAAARRSRRPVAKVSRRGPRGLGRCGGAPRSR